MQYHLETFDIVTTQHNLNTVVGLDTKMTLQTTATPHPTVDIFYWFNTSFYFMDQIGSAW